MSSQVSCLMSLGSNHFLLRHWHCIKEGRSALAFCRSTIALDVAFAHCIIEQSLRTPMGPCFGSCSIRGTLDRPKAEYIVTNYVRPFQQNEKREAQMGKVILLTFFMTFLIIPATRAECDRLFVKENALFIH